MKYLKTFNESIKIDPFEEEDWEEVDKEDDIKNDENNLTNYRRHFDSVNGRGDFIVATSKSPTSKDHGTALVSTDGGDNWTKYENNTIPEITQLIAVGEGGSSKYKLNSWKQID